MYRTNSYKILLGKNKGKLNKWTCYGLDDSVLQRYKFSLDYYILPCNLNQNPRCGIIFFFPAMYKSIQINSKIHMEMQRPRKDKLFLKKNKYEGLTL